MKDYYREIDMALVAYEEFKPWKEKDIDWICHRIDWCYKWKHITESEMKILADRVIYIMDNGYCQEVFIVTNRAKYELLKRHHNMVEYTNIGNKKIMIFQHNTLNSMFSVTMQNGNVTNIRCITTPKNNDQLFFFLWFNVYTVFTIYWKPRLAF